MRHASLIALPGTIITCPGCQARIGTLRKALYQQWTFGLDAIRFERGQERTDCAQCRVCGASYAEVDVQRNVQSGKVTRTMLIHTDYGWLPRPPPGGAEPPRPPMRPAA